MKITLLTTISLIVFAVVFKLVYWIATSIVEIRQDIRRIQKDVSRCENISDKWVSFNAKKPFYQNDYHRGTLREHLQFIYGAVYEIQKKEFDKLKPAKKTSSKKESK